MPFFQGQQIVSLDCGVNSSIFLSADGSIFITGKNEKEEADSLMKNPQGENTDTAIPLKVAGIDEQISAVYCTTFFAAISVNKNMYI